MAASVAALGMVESVPEQGDARVRTQYKEWAPPELGEHSAWQGWGR